MPGLVRACHPAPTAVVTGVAVLLGVGAGLAAPILVLVGLTVLVGQLSIGWSNDWLDAVRDRQAGRWSKPAVSGDVSVGHLRLAALVTGSAAVPLSLLAGVPAGSCHLVLVVSGWGYNLGLKAGVWSVAPYLVGFGALPVYVVLAGDEAVPWWLPLVGALLGGAAHFANAAPDIEADLAGGVNGLPQRVGTQRSLAVSLAALVAAGGLTLLQLQPLAPWWTSVVVAPPVLGMVTLARGRVRAVFPLVLTAAVCDVLLMTLAT